MRFVLTSARLLVVAGALALVSAAFDPARATSPAAADQTNTTTTFTAHDLVPPAPDAGTGHSWGGTHEDPAWEDRETSQDPRRGTFRSDEFGGHADPGSDEAEVGDPYRGQQWGLDRLRAEDAWAVRDAAGTTIAVVDSGVDRAHEDLENVTMDGFDALDATGDGGIDESVIGHGTGIAGIAGAEVDNGLGIAGLARGTQILPVRVLENRTGDEQDVAAGVRYASEHGADVINLSLGGPDRSPVLAEELAAARRGGAVVVASSGNSAQTGNPVMWPAADPGVVAVSAVDSDHERAPYANHGDWLDLSAPGHSVLTTCPVSDGCTSGYAYRSGTSFAAPHVAGTAALLSARYPRALPSQLVARMTRTAGDLGNSGFDPEYGHGIVDPLAALTELPDLGCRDEVAEPVDRSWDRGRVETAVAVACTHWERSDEVVLATARDFPDALAGAAVAASRGIPLLLVEPDHLGLHVEEALAALDVEHATLLGGVSALSDEIIEALDALEVTSDRIAGENRYATAAGAAEGHRGGTILLASGEAFPDAVAAGGLLAVEDDSRILLTYPDRVPGAVSRAIADAEPDRVIVVGGPRAVQDVVLDELRSVVDGDVERLGGADRYETSALVADAAHEQLDATAPLVAVSGAAFPDALAAGALVGRLEGSLVLVPPDSLDDEAPARDVLARGWGRAEIVGGAAAVHDSVRDELRRLVTE